MKLRNKLEDGETRRYNTANNDETVWDNNNEVTPEILHVFQHEVDQTGVYLI